VGHATDVAEGLDPAESGDEFESAAAGNWLNSLPVFIQA
jgi:hypothetical protein